jgi:hypothetical protein
VTGFLQWLLVRIDGQQTARRNAWVGLVELAGRRRDREQAAAALATAQRTSTAITVSR